jgi:hypothetical protein
MKIYKRELPLVHKGIASWIWIIGSVLFGLIIFYAGYVLISGQINNSANSLMLESVSSLNSELKRICVSGGIGSESTKDITLPASVKAVYIAKSQYSPPPDKVSVMISNKDTAAGTYLCYQLSDTENNLPKKCWNLSCTANFTYIGTPTMKKTLSTFLSQIMGSTPAYNYRLYITKTGEHNITVSAEPIIKKS